MRLMPLYSSAVLFSVALIAPGHAAVSVTLDCSAPLANQGFPPDSSARQMVDVDYDKGTVREYYMDDDGAVRTDRLDKTYPAHVTDNEITWSDGYKGTSESSTLGRITAILTWVFMDPGNPSMNQTQRHQCKKWTPPTQAPQF